MKLITEEKTIKIATFYTNVKEHVGICVALSANGFEWLGDKTIARLYPRHALCGFNSDLDDFRLFLTAKGVTHFRLDYYTGEGDDFLTVIK